MSLAPLISSAHSSPPRLICRGQVLEGHVPSARSAFRRILSQVWICHRCELDPAGLDLSQVCKVMSHLYWIMDDLFATMRFNKKCRSMPPNISLYPHICVTPNLSAVCGYMRATRWLRSRREGGWCWPQGGKPYSHRTRQGSTTDMEALASGCCAVFILMLESSPLRCCGAPRLGPRIGSGTQDSRRTTRAFFLSTPA